MEAFVFVLQIFISFKFDFSFWNFCWLIVRILNNILCFAFLWKQILNCIGYSADRKLLTLSESEPFRVPISFNSFCRIIFAFVLLLSARIFLSIFLCQLGHTRPCQSWHSFIYPFIYFNHFPFLYDTATIESIMHNPHYIHTFFKKNKTEESFIAALLFSL